jgi:transcriptional regulator with XRE-family HTH domain
MSGSEIKQRRVRAGIPGRLVCARARVDRSRLSHIEREYVVASESELAKISRALDELIQAKRKVVAAAAEAGWPISAL